MTTFLITIIILALIFDYINGFHDAANSIATIVSTKVLTPFQAVLWAAVFNFVAFFIFKDHAVANTIGKTVKEDFITLPVIFSGLLAAIGWNLLTWWYGIPSSSSHTLIGGFAGAAITHALMTKGWMPIREIIDSQKVLQILLFIFLAPVIGMIISMFIALVTITRNTWVRLAIMAASGLFVWVLFNKLEQKKIKENLSKFYQVDKLKEQAAKDSSKQAAYMQAQENYKKAAPLAKEFNSIGAEKIAANIAAITSLKDVETAKLNDKLTRYFRIKQLKNEAQANPVKKPLYDSALAHYNLL
ncbi:MAG: inorganic phosphate transporter, partial [Dinghuibacter sp.]|nr:inorganic phosphate transporter [Dinghuibacter sp.]